MNAYLIGVIISLAVYLVVGAVAGRKVKGVNDYYVAGRRAPTILIAGSLVASFLSTGAFLGDTGEVYAGFFVPIVIVGVLQATGYLWGSSLFGRYIRRSEALTLPDYFAKRFQSDKIRKLAAIITIFAVSAYMLSAMQGISTLMAEITGLEYKWCVIIAWISFTLFTIYSGSMGVLLTDTIMFLVFLSAAFIAIPYVTSNAGGWFEAIHNLAASSTSPGIISWHSNLSYMYPTGGQNIAWAVTYGIVWMLVVMVSPWQTSRYLMAKNEHTVMRSAVWASMGVMLTTLLLYFMAVFVQSVNPDLVPSKSMIWAAMNMMPTIVGVVLLAGILAAGISSASTFLSLIGFSLTNDIFRTQTQKAGTDKKRLMISRIGMLIASLVILVIAYFNPPQIFVIMYFGGTVIASSWGAVAIASIWSKKLSKTGAFAGMLSGFLACAIVKIVSGVVDFEWPMYLDPFIIGVIVSIIAMVIGSKLRPISNEEIAERQGLFVVPEVEKGRSDCAHTIKTGYIYIAFGVILVIGLLVFWALPYTGVL